MIRDEIENLLDGMLDKELRKLDYPSASNWVRIDWSW